MVEDSKCGCGGGCVKSATQDCPEVWPEGCKILIEADKVDDRTAGGIWYSQQTKEDEQTRVNIGTVLRCGPDAVSRLANPGEEARQLTPGDRIVFARYGGFRLMFDKNRDFRIINDEDVLAVVRGAL